MENQKSRWIGLFGILAIGAMVLDFASAAMHGAKAAGSKRPPIEYFPVPGTNAPPYTPAIRVGDVLYVTIQLGTGPGGKVPETTEAQAHATMDNLAAVLKRSGSSMDNVFKCAVIIADQSKWDAFNTVYRTYFKPGKLPVRSAFGTTSLHLGAPMGIECEAYSPET